MKGISFFSYSIFYLSIFVRLWYAFNFFLSFLSFLSLCMFTLLLFKNYNFIFLVSLSFWCDCFFISHFFSISFVHSFLTIFQYPLQSILFYWKKPIRNIFLELTRTKTFLRPIFSIHSK